MKCFMILRDGLHYSWRRGIALSVRVGCAGDRFKVVIYLIARVSLPVHELVLGDLVLDRPQPRQHDAGVQLCLCLEARWLGWYYRQREKEMKHCSQNT
jgi:hypothetical protein